MSGRERSDRAWEERIEMMDAHIDLVLNNAITRLRSGWMSEEFSPLGPVWHRRAVLMRMSRARARGEECNDAARLDGHYYLKIEAVADEYFHGPRSVVRARRRALEALPRPRAANDNSR